MYKEKTSTITEESNISIDISREHSQFVPEVEACFKEAGFSVSASYMRLSAQELPMQILIFVGSSIAGGFIYDLLKAGIRKALSKFNNASIVLEDQEGILFAIREGEKVNAVVVSDKRTEFDHIKTLDDLIAHLRKDKKQILTETKLREVAEIQTGPFGSQLHNKDYVQIGTPIITVEHLVDDKIIHASDIPRVSIEDKARLKKYVLREGDIVFSRVGSVDRSAYVTKEEDGWMFSGRLLRVRPKIQKIDRQFLHYWLIQKEIKEFVRRVAVGATMPSINTTILGEIPVSYPSIPTQKAIAAVLTSFDDKIELLRQQNQTLEEMAQTLFKEWFVDFRFPGVGKMVDSELGLIPEGWKVKGFLDQFELLSGGTPKTSIPEYWNGTIKWVSAKDVTPNHRQFILDTEKCISELGLNKSATKLLPEFTVIISARGTVGKYCLLSEPACISQSNYGVRAKNLRLNFYTYLVVGNQISTLKSQAYGSVFDTITTSTFKGLSIVCPPDGILYKFEEVVDSFFKKILNNSFQIKTLTTFRDSLLPKLMSGEIRVKM
jgi:type I restriction enzyme S subunit